MKVVALFVGFVAVVNAGFAIAAMTGVDVESPSVRSLYGGISTAQFAIAWLMWREAE